MSLTGQRGRRKDILDERNKVYKGAEQEKKLREYQGG